MKQTSFKTSPHISLESRFRFFFKLMTPSIVVRIIFSVGFSIFQELVDDPRLAVGWSQGIQP